MPTRDNGIETTADFRAYANLSAGFKGYADFLLTNDRYNRHVGEKSGVKFVSKILASGYCPDPQYLSHIQAIIDKHGLDRLDAALETIVENKEAVASTPVVPDTAAGVKN